MKINNLIFKSIICIPLFIFVSWNRLYGSEISLEATVVPESATVGVPLTYTLNIFGIDPDNLKIILHEKKIVYPEKKK